MTTTFLRRVGVCASALFVFAAPGTAFAQAPPSTTRTIGAYVNANFGVALPSDSPFTNGVTFTFGSQSEGAVGEYPINSGFAYEFGGGIVIKRRWIAGVAFSRATSSDPGEITLTFNHPPTHGPISDSVATAPFDRKESAFHIQGGVLVPMGRAELMIFGGPSRFSVSQRTVIEISADEDLGPSGWFLTVFDPISGPQSASAWGYNIGADVSFAIGHGLSVGGQVRFSQATVDIADPLAALMTTGATKEMTVGGTQILGGVRWRF